MAEVHAGGRGPAVGRLAGKPEDAEVGHPRCIAALQNQEKQTTPQNPIFETLPGAGLITSNRFVVPSLAA